MDIAKIIASELGVLPKYVEAVIELIDGGATIPFIARYRKEAHGAMDDQKLRELSERLQQLRSLEKRKEEISDSLKKLGCWTEELQNSIDSSSTVGQLEDIYRPYRPKRRTRAMIAKERGLETLADIIYLQISKAKNIDEIAQPFVCEEKGVATADDAVSGAKDIIAERISDNPDIRTKLKKIYYRDCQIKTVASTEDDSVYRMYYDYSEPIRTIASHRILAINRGEKEGMLKVSLTVPEGEISGLMENECIAHTGSITTALVKEACQDSYDRLIAPSLETEFRNELTDKAQKASIHVFAANLKPLLMQPPVKGHVAIGLDPGYRMGCKTAVVDPTGKVLDTAVIFPVPQFGKVDQAKAIVKKLILKHGVTIAAIGNGTASRETEEFFVEVMKELNLGNKLSYMVVSEAGASVYSASKLAADEFPEYDVNLRSAISIARRLQDPLAELVKIDPKAIGVGQYQHDLKESELDDALAGVVEDCVNAVGVDVNTASVSLLKHIAGINSAVAANIVTYRNENGLFESRAQLKKVKGLGPKAYEQCAGFLRISDGKELMDNTGVHPESYSAAKALLKKLGVTEKEAAGGKLMEMISAKDYVEYAAELQVGEPTLHDIVKELSKPGRDPRDELPQPLLRSDILSIESLTPGMELKGTVRNVTDFGAFVDIGVHHDGLIHVSQMSRNRKRPQDVLKVGDIITVWVLNVDVKKERIGLTLFRPAGENKSGN